MTIRLELTPTQAKVLWNVVDGAADAGACEGGNTPREAKALQEISFKLLSYHNEFKGINLGD